MKQNELSVQDYGKEISELFVQLTISQANGNSDNYNVLKPLNEQYAIKKFSEGLRNRKLSTIITARSYSSLKDAIQAAQDEEIASTSTSGEVFGMYNNNNKFKRGFRHNYGHRGHASHTYWQRKPPQGVYRSNNSYRGGWNGPRQPQQQHHQTPDHNRPGYRAKFYNNRNKRMCNNNSYKVNVISETEVNREPSNSNNSMQFFRE